MGRRTFLSQAGNFVAGGAAVAVGLDARAARRAAAASGSITVLMGPSAVRPELVGPFEEKTGIKVVVAPYVSPTDVMTKMLAPGGTRAYDVMGGLTDLSLPIVEKGLLLPLDMSKIPNVQHLNPMFKQDVLVREGKPYTLPFYWGYDSVLFNTSKVPENDATTQSWGVLFDERYKGRVALRDDAHQSILVTALHMGHKDPLGMDRSDLKEVVRYLISKKSHFRALWSGFAQAINLMASGEVWAMYGWILMRTTLQRQGHPVSNNWPRDGLIVWTQVAFVPKDTAAAPEAYVWLNHLLSKEYGAALTKVNGGILSCSRLVESEFSKAEMRQLGYDLNERGLNLVRLGLPKHLDQWLEAWAEFKSA
jgi:spermidine/putrescine-binding protein